MGLELNPGKTVWMGARVGAGLFHVGGREVARSGSMVYLGVEMGPDGGMAGELDRRFGAANGAFWALRRLWSCAGVSVATKCRVYEAVVRGTLLYGAEGWPLRVADQGRLCSWDLARLRWVLGLKWADRVRGVEVLARSGLRGLGEVAAARRWRWLGHVLRMGEGRWPRRVLLWSAGEEEGAARRVGAPRLSWLRGVLREGWASIPWKELGVAKPHWVHWERGRWRELLAGLAADRGVWRRLVGGVADAAARRGLLGHAIT